MARPKKYDEVDVLDRSLEAFWVNGFDGTSLDMLDEATGLNRGSIYNAFGDKHGLYLAALDHYGQTQFGAAARMIRASGPTPIAVRRLYDAAIAIVGSGEVKRGCFVCNAAVELAPSDPEVASKVQKYIKILTTAFRDSLVETRSSTFPHESPDSLTTVAVHLTASYMGFNVMAKAGVSIATLKRIRDSVVNSLE